VKRIEYSCYGGPETMHLAAFDALVPGPEDILVRVNAASINPVDWKIRQGEMKLLTGSSFPRAMGKDFAGTILQVGNKISGWKAGDEVLGCVPWKRGGAFAPLALVRSNDIVQKPKAVSFVQAAALPTIGLTAWHGLVQEAKLQHGQSLLVNGAAGGVGTVVLQIAHSLNVRITARASPRSFERLKEMGVATVLDYRNVFPSNLDNSFDVIFDCNGSITSGDIDRLLKSGGVAVDINIKAPKLLRSIFLRRQKLAFGSVDQKTLMAIGEFAGSGHLRVDIGAEVSIEDAIPLIARLEAGESIDGKAVIVFD
jgi:NADPH:quinone reductase-like Zn-dependent oxidoreductase